LLTLLPYARFLTNIKQPWVQHGSSEQSEAKPGVPKAVIL